MYISRSCRINKKKLSETTLSILFFIKRTKLRVTPHRCSSQQQPVAKTRLNSENIDLYFKDTHYTVHKKEGLHQKLIQPFFYCESWLRNFISYS